MFGRCARLLLSLTLVCAAAFAETSPTIESNFNYRQSWGELGVPVVVPPTLHGTKRAVQLSGDTSAILHLCETSPGWQKDPIFFRLAHRGARTSIGCREKASPSVHAVFYKKPDGGREAWVHFDLHGPQNPMVHLTEVFRNRMTFGRTSQEDVRRGLVRTRLNLLPDDQQTGEVVPGVRYDLREHTRQYLEAVLSPRAMTTSIATGFAIFEARKIMGENVTQRSIPQRVARNLVRNGVAQSIEFGTAAFLQQEQAYVPSMANGYGRRSLSALYRSFVVPGRDGDELAFPRIAASMGTPWVMHQWSQGRIDPPPNPWMQSAIMMGKYVARSYWGEFGPDVKQKLRKVLPEFLR